MSIRLFKIIFIFVICLFSFQGKIIAQNAMTDIEQKQFYSIVESSTHVVIPDSVKHILLKFNTENNLPNGLEPKQFHLLKALYNTSLSTKEIIFYCKAMLQFFSNENFLPIELFSLKLQTLERVQNK